MNRKAVASAVCLACLVGGTGLLSLLPKGDAPIGAGIPLMALLVASPLLARRSLQEIAESHERGRGLALATLAISAVLIAVAIMMLFLPLF